MLMIATKLSVKKTAIGLAIVLAVGGGIGWLTQEEAPLLPVMGQSTLAQTCKTNEERVAYLQSYGWQVDVTPLAEQEVRIPDTFDAAYQSYNALQQAQGLDLTPCQGKNAMLYSYAVHNENQVGVTASLVLYKDKVVAADISAVGEDGFVHGITTKQAE